MNDQQRDRLEARIAPDHECTPYNGGCHLPHYWHNHTSPRYQVAWPAPTAARALLDEIREERDWLTE